MESGLCDSEKAEIPARGSKAGGVSKNGGSFGWISWPEKGWSSGTEDLMDWHAENDGLCERMANIKIRRDAT